LEELVLVLVNQDSGNDVSKVERFASMFKRIEVDTGT